MAKLHFPKNHSFNVAKYRLVIDKLGIDQFVPVNQPEVEIDLKDVKDVTIHLHYYDAKGTEIGGLERDLNEGLEFIPGQLNLTNVPTEPEIQELANSIRDKYLTEKKDEDAGEQIRDLEGWKSST